MAIVKPHPIVFVPGLLGSELASENRTIWPADRRGLSTVLFPSYLLPWLPLQALKPLGVYDRFLAFLTQVKGYGTDDLFLFSYDWRVGIEAAARQLGNFVDATVRRSHGGQIIFIAHSLGCLVVRFAISNGFVAAGRTKMIVAAGPPGLGSAAAFKSLVEMPEIHEQFDRLYNLARMTWPNFSKRTELSLTKSLMTVRSLLELMPPNSVPILIERNSRQLFSAFQWWGWPTALASLVAEAGQTQSALQAGPWPLVPVTLVLSEKWPTEVGYLLDKSDPFTILAKTKTLPGDRRVLVDSARSFAAGASEWLVGAKHDELLDDPITISNLNALL